MNLWLIIKSEFKHNRFTLLSGILSLIVATAGFVGILTLLQGHDVLTEQIVLEKEKELRREMTELEDDYRRIMRRMGYNVLVLHEDQSISELNTRGYPTTYMDYEDAWTLAESDIETLNHLLPVLQEAIYWEDHDMDIILSGVRGQVPVYSKPEFLTEDMEEYRNPIMERVPDGKVDVGYTVAQSLRLEPGETIHIKGEEFSVNQIYDHQGTTHDITVWIPLAKAQEFLGKEGKINGIFALECVCDLDQLGMITEEVQKALPHAQVFEFSSLVAARADVRQRASLLHQNVIESVMEQRLSLRREKEQMASIVVPLLILGAMIWIFILIYNNVRERKSEIGILRAVGVTRNQILLIFLGKAVLMGVVGGLAGSFAGILIGISGSGLEHTGVGWGELVNPMLVLYGCLLAPLLSLAAGFIPAILASNRDPAVILREE